ncbi:MAG: hypothetical protein ACOC04_03355 [Halothece sp.]
MNSLQAERLESVKAGIFAALSFAIAFSLVTVVNTTLLIPQIPQISLPIPTGNGLFFQVAIALFSGFLFGITYRYIIRTDNNSHLNDGAVLAFGLVRGLATAEIDPLAIHQLLNLGILTLESLFCFAIARFTLDFALSRHWLNPFKG